MGTRLRWRLRIPASEAVELHASVLQNHGAQYSDGYRLPCTRYATLPAFYTISTTFRLQLPALDLRVESDRLELLGRAAWWRLRDAVEHAHRVRSQRSTTRPSTGKTHPGYQPLPVRRTQMSSAEYYGAAARTPISSPRSKKGPPLRPSDAALGDPHLSMASGSIRLRSASPCRSGPARGHLVIFPLDQPALRASMAPCSGLKTYRSSKTYASTLILGRRNSRTWPLGGHFRTRWRAHWSYRPHTWAEAYRMRKQAS